MPNEIAACAKKALVFVDEFGVLMAPPSPSYGGRGAARVPAPT
jgi:hypothetical protein